ncbi:MAG: 4Fe-4S dicluster domain-containing protein [Deltaproteobacteria bacterium]|nr:4Fe-4S dicluster domain-containing protein [Deltaproteobacteria bacterium]
MAQLGFHVNIDNCIACRGCEAACKQEYDLPIGVRRRRVIIEEGVQDGTPWRRSISMACNHCATPACLHACPVNRYWKDEAGQEGVDALRAFFGFSGDYTGIVLYRPRTVEDANLGVDCIGCKRCLVACPYGAPQWDEATAAMDKCQACYHRLFPADGSTLPVEKQQPACVVTCTAMALSFGDIADVDDWAQRAAGAPIEVDTAPPDGGRDITNPELTTPSIRFTPLSI